MMRMVASTDARSGRTARCQTAAHVGHLLGRRGGRAPRRARASLNGQLQQVGVAGQVAGAQLRQARLPRAEEVARPAQLAGPSPRSGTRRSSPPSPRSRSRAWSDPRAGRRARSTTRARRGRRARATGAAAPARSARRARSPSRSRSARPRRLRSPSSTPGSCTSPSLERAHHAHPSSSALHAAVQQRRPRGPGTPPSTGVRAISVGRLHRLLRLLDHRIDDVRLPPARPPRARTKLQTSSRRGPA